MKRPPLLFVLAALLTFTACHGSKKEIVGKWKSEGGQGEMLWEFNDNGTVSVGGKPGKYSLGAGGRVKVQTQTATFVNQLEIKEDRMSWKAPDGSKQEFKRVK